MDVTINFLVSLFSAAAIAATPELPLKSAGVFQACSYSEFEPISYGEGLGYEPALLEAMASLWQVKLHI